MEGKAIIKNATRVLTPFEYEKLRAALNPVYQAMCDVLLHTGLRMPEFWDMLRHPEWYDAKRRCIEVPKRTVQKKKLKVVYRQVNLNLPGCEAIEHLFKVNPRHVSRQAMTETLCFAARKAELPELDKGVAPKMFRKTIVSWLMKTYPEKTFEISASAGHSLEVMRDHYSNLAFAAQDREDIKKFVKGWGEA